MALIPLVVSFLFLKHLEITSAEKLKNSSPKDLLRFNCDFSCKEKCSDAGTNIDSCLDNCGCKSFSSQYLKSDQKLNEEPGKVKLWIKIKESRNDDLSICKQECDQFCLSLGGNYFSCSLKCAEKFCSENETGFRFWSLGLVAFTLVFCVILKRKKSQKVCFRDDCREGFEFSRI